MRDKVQLDCVDSSSELGGDKGEKIHIESGTHVGEDGAIGLTSVWVRGGASEKAGGKTVSTRKPL